MNNSKSNIDWINVGLIIFLVLFYIINNYMWLTRGPSYTDDSEEASAYTEMLAYANVAKTGDIAHCMFLLSIPHLYVPGYFVPAICAHLMYDAGYRDIIQLNNIYFLLLLISMYLLAITLYDRKIASFALLFISLYPGMYCFSRKYYIEIGLLWIIVLTVYLLVKSRMFEKTGFSLLAGGAIGVGLMTKAPYALSVFPLLGYYAVSSLITGEKDSRIKRIRNILLMSAIAVLMAGYKYIRLGVLKHHIMIFATEPGAHPVWYYGSVLYEFMLSPLFFLVFIAGLCWIMLREKHEIKIMLLFWFLPFFLYHSFMMHHKLYRYILPLLPCCALISARGLYALRQTRIRRILICVLLLFGVIQYYIISFGAFPVLAQTPMRYIVDSNTFSQWNPQQRNIVAEEIINHLNASGLHYNGAFTFMMFPYEDKEHVPEELHYEATVWNAMSSMMGLPYTLSMLDMTPETFPYFANHIREADAIVFMGSDDLSNGSGFMDYMNAIIAQEVAFERISPFYLVGRQSKSQAESIFPEEQIQLLKETAKHEFAQFSLYKTFDVESAEKPFTVYVYTRTNTNK